MLANARVHPTLPGTDLKRAREFYEKKLGLKVINEDNSSGQLDGIVFQAGEGTMLYMYRRSPTKADHTVAEFEVDNVEAEVNDLKNKGIKFEEYDIPAMGIKTVNGVATMGESKGAWMKDTEGNILAVSDFYKVAMKSSQKVGAQATR